MNLNPILPPSQSPSSVVIKPHKLIQGVYISSDGNVLYTKNLVPGQTPLYSDEVVTSVKADGDDGTVEEYREWNPYKSKLAAAILCGAQNIWIRPGSRVLVLFSHSQDDDRFGTTISHISDIVGPQGMVFVVNSTNRDTLEILADKRFNIVPIVLCTYPFKYRMLINMVDVLFGAMDRQLQFEFAYLNAKYFLEAGGHYVLCVEASRGDAPFDCLYKGEERSQFKKIEHVSLEPFDKDHAYSIGGFRLDLDEPVNTSWTNPFWAEPHLNRGDEEHVTLYEKQKNLPAYMLFESSLGYALFRVHNVYDVDRNYKAIEKYINRIDKVFKRVAYYPFESANEALMYLNAVNNDTVPEQLIDFLVRYLPKPIEEGGENCYSLSLPQSTMVHHIVLHTKIACSRSLFHDEIMRGVRMHIDTFFEDMKPGDLEKTQLDLARNYCRQSPSSPDKGKSVQKRGGDQASTVSRKKPSREGQSNAKTK